MDADYTGKHRDNSNAAWDRYILRDRDWRDPDAYQARHEASAEQVAA